ncbi:transmembrane protein, putative [Medicago truncatula]|uniref:Transmembrane protein, putative n=1 Tax=Medicago truncatula TaxID=3880 RepID=G7J1X8_MEDTR|nr:transmembrane protein, putative [Medicago truncatula]
MNQNNSAYTKEKHTFPGVVLRTSFIAFIAVQQLTFHSTLKRVWLGKSSLYSQPYSFP